MAAHPEPARDPIDEEIEWVFANNPGLLEELQEFARRHRAGEVREDEFVSHEEVRRRLGMGPPEAW